MSIRFVNAAGRASAVVGGALVDVERASSGRFGSDPMQARAGAVSAAELNNRGAALLNEGRPEEAAARFDEALRLQPDFAAAHNSFGIALANLGEMTQAIEQFKEAVSLDPDFSEARRNLALALGSRR